MKKENLTISEIQDLVKKVISEKSEPKKELRDAYEKLKKVRKELKERGKNNSDLKKYKTTMRELADEIEEMEDEEKVEMEEGANDEVIEKNEQSEGYGTFKGLGMNENRRVIKLKESDLKRVIQRVVKESGKFTSKKKVKPLKEQAAPEDLLEYLIESTKHSSKLVDDMINGIKSNIEEGYDYDNDLRDNIYMKKPNGDDYQPLPKHLVVIPRFILDKRFPTLGESYGKYIDDNAQSIIGLLEKMKSEDFMVNREKAITKLAQMDIHPSWIDRTNLKEAPEKDTYWVISKADRENLLKMGGEAEVIGKSATNDFSKYCR